MIRFLRKCCAMIGTSPNKQIEFALFGRAPRKQPRCLRGGSFAALDAQSRCYD
jgi:hypothetical protein